MTHVGLEFGAVGVVCVRPLIVLASPFLFHSQISVESRYSVSCVLSNYDIAFQTLLPITSNNLQMSSDDLPNKNFGKAMDFVGPIVDRWIKELFKGFEAPGVSRAQKDLIQGLTIETMLFNSLMPNDEIIAVLAGIIRNISTKNSYGMSLDWGKREKVFDNYSIERK